MRTGKSRFCRALLFALLRSFSSLALSVILSPPSEHDWLMNWSRPHHRNASPLDGRLARSVMPTRDWLTGGETGGWGGGIRCDLYEVILVDGYHNTDGTNDRKAQHPWFETHECIRYMFQTINVSVVTLNPGSPYRAVWKCNSRTRLLS